MSAEVVWVSITGRASKAQGLPRYHALQTCCDRRRSGVRLPTLRDEAERAGCPPCHFCVGDVAQSDGGAGWG